MVKTPTVLVLGAGASNPYGYPTGLRLLKDVLAYLDPSREGNWLSTLEELEYTPEEIAEFRRRLWRCGLQSVDAFLEHKPNHGFIGLGKDCIALGLIAHEEEDALFDLDRTGAWYSYLYGKLNAPLDNFGRNELSVITFNYDRSLEHFLFTAIQNTHDAGDDEIVASLEGVPIIHVYGQLGPMPWQVGGRVYTVRASAKEVRAVAQAISIYGEPDREEATAQFAQAREALAMASNIYFLGFGFHEANLERLQFDRIRDLGQKTRRGTTFGLGASEIRAIEARWPLELPPTYPRVAEFLRNHVRW